MTCPSGAPGAGRPPSRANSCSSVSVLSCSAFKFSGFFFSATAGSSVAEIHVLQRLLDLHVPHQLNGGLQIIALLAADPQLVTLDGGLHLELAVLDRLHDLLGQRAVDPLL